MVKDLSVQSDEFYLYISERMDTVKRSVQYAAGR